MCPCGAVSGQQVVEGRVYISVAGTIVEIVYFLIFY